MAAGAVDVVDDPGLAEIFLGEFCEKAGHCVSAASGIGRNDDCHRFGWIVGRECSGSGEDETEREDCKKCFFHVLFSFQNLKSLIY